MSETVKIKPSHKSQGKYVIIPLEQFDPAIHELADGEILPDSLISGEPLVGVVSEEQFSALAEKLAWTEEQLSTSQGELIAFKNDVEAMKARIAELQGDTPPVGATNENPNPTPEEASTQVEGVKENSKNTKQLKAQE